MFISIQSEFAFLLTRVCSVSDVSFSRTRVRSLSYFSRIPLNFKMQRTLSTNDHGSNVKQQINHYNISTITKSRQPFKHFVQLFTEEFRDIGSG